MAFGSARLLLRRASQSSAAAQFSAQESFGASSSALRLSPQGRTHAARVEPTTSRCNPETILASPALRSLGYWSKEPGKCGVQLLLHPVVAIFILPSTTPEGPLEVLESDAVLPDRKDAISVEVGGQAVLGRQLQTATPWLTERHGYDPTLWRSVAFASSGGDLYPAVHNPGGSSRSPRERCGAS